MDPVIGRPPMAPPIAPAPIRPRRTSRPRSPPQKAKWVHWILLAAFTVVILGVGMVLGSLIKPSAGKRDWSMERSPFYSPIVPISDNRRFSLNPNKKYFGAPSVENDAAWENICGEEGGRVAISDKRVLRNLPQSIQGANKGEQIYGIGVCYQLHCLNHLRLALYGQERMEHSVHLDYCIDFLREVLMCKADVAMHYWRAENETGWDVVHQCWNFDRVVEWAREHKTTRAPVT